MVTASMSMRPHCFKVSECNVDCNSSDVSNKHGAIMEGLVWNLLHDLAF